jgi:hypothetical protein
LEFFGYPKKYTYIKYNTGAETSKASNSVRHLLDILNKCTNVSNKFKKIYYESKPFRAQIFWQTPSFIKGAATPGAGHITLNSFGVA